MRRQTGMPVAIRDFFKGNETLDREPMLRDPEQILAWMEELCRIHGPMELSRVEADQLPILAKVAQVGEETGTLTLQLQRLPQPEPKAGQTFELLFHLDGQRFRTEVVYKGRGGYMQSQFELPKGIRHAERRGAVRTRFGTREKAKVVVLEGLYDGLALSGELLNLSMGGCAFRLARALDVKGGRRLSLRADLLAPGAVLTLLRLQDLPHAPTVECGATVSHVEQRAEGIVMGVRFEGLGSFESQVIGKVLVQRIPGFRLTFPRKRRQWELTEEELTRPQPAEQAEEETEALVPPTEVEEALSDQELEELRIAVKAPDRHTLLKKRGKHILLLMADELERSLLLATLHVDGYRSLFEAKSLVQALDVNRKASLDMVIVDQHVGHHGALELVEALRAADLPKGTPVIVLQRNAEVRLSVAAKAGGVSLVLGHPVDFDGKLKPALEGLLGLA